MIKRRRRQASAFKFRVALEGSKTISQLLSEHEIHANQIGAWKRQLLEDGLNVFATNGERKKRGQEAQKAELYEQFGRLKMELEWLRESCSLRSVRDRAWSIASMTPGRSQQTGCEPCPTV